MELKDLSGNWKRLQKTIQGGEQPNLRKRKTDAQLATSPEATAKRLRLGEKHQAKRAHDSGGGGLSRYMEKNNALEKSSASLTTWAEDNDIPATDLALAYGPGSKLVVGDGSWQDKINNGLSSTAIVGKYIGIDCEMVGVGEEPEQRSVLARASIVNYHGEQVYDSFVKPKEFVTDWRTWVSGIAPRHMKTARDFEVVQRDVANLLQDRILVGHAIYNDLDALFLSHPKRNIRDTARHPPFRKCSAGRAPALKKLAREILGLEIQAGEHSSVEDARACMLLYRRNKDSFEAEHAKRWPSISFDSGDKGNSAKKPKQRRKKKKK